MREYIKIIDNDNIAVKNCIYNKDETGLVFAIRCLTQEYDDLKLEYDRLIEQHKKVISITNVDGDAYIMSFRDLSNRLGVSVQTLMTLTSRTEFNEYYTYITRPRKCKAIIVTQKSLELLRTFLGRNKNRRIIEENLDKLLEDIKFGKPCER